MIQQLFTQDGVNAKLAELSGLSDTARAQQTDSLTKDFRGWMQAHFSLTTDQQKYLSGLDERFIRLAGAQLYVAINTKLPVKIIVPPHGGVISSKLSLNSGNVGTSDDAKGGFSANGEVAIEFRYL